MYTIFDGLATEREGPKALLAAGLSCERSSMIATRVRSDEPYVLADTAAEALRQGLGVDEHEVVVILGSGWAGAADGLGDVVADVELSSLPGFPTDPKHD